jgi:hypothetical protein
MEKEIWVEAFNHDNYEVSNLGGIRRKKNGRVLLQQLSDREYNIVTISTNGQRSTKRISKLVWESFNNCQCKQTVDHIDRDKRNNTLGNLRCISASENMKNRPIYKEKNKYNLTEELKKEIVNKVTSKEWTIYKVWKIYGIPTNYTTTIMKRGSWNYLLND